LTGAGNEIVHVKYQPSHVINVDDHPDRVKNDVADSTHRTHFIDVTACFSLFTVSLVVPYLLRGFYPRDAMLAQVYATAFPSVCVPHACFVSKRLNISSKFFYA